VTVYKVSASQVHNSLIIVPLRADNDNPPMIIVITREETRKPPNLLTAARRAPRSPRGGSNEFSGAIIRGLIRRDECARAPF